MERNHSDNIAYFIAFCTEIYKNAHSITGAETSKLFSSCGIMKYLEDNYDVLHTQSPQWILEEINDQIKRESK